MTPEQQQMMAAHHAHTATWVVGQYNALVTVAAAQGLTLDARGALLAAAQLYRVAAEGDRMVQVQGRALDEIDV